MEEPREKSIKEEWFKKKGGKGALVTTKAGTGKRRYFVLTDRYLDWFLQPKGERKGSLSLDNIYVRIIAEKHKLVLGQYGRPKEFKMIYDGQDPREVVQSWFDAVSKAIDDYKKKKMEGGTDAFKYVVDRGTERAGDFLEGSGRQATITTLLDERNVSGPPQPITTVVQPQPQVMMNPTPIISQPQPQVTMIQQPMMQQTMMPQPQVTMIQPMMQQPMMQTFIPPPTVVHTIAPPMYSQQMMMCMFCRNQIPSYPGTVVRCPYCQQINNPYPPTVTTTTYTTMPPYY